MSYEGAPQIQQTRSACAGASTAYVIQHVAAQANSWAPGVQDRLIADLNLDLHGAEEDPYIWR
jgi:hypothetical protein